MPAHSEPTTPLQAVTKTNCFIYFITIVSAVGGFLFGYDTGVISGAMVQLKNYFKLNLEWQEFIVSSAILSAWLSSLIGGILSDKYGRKRIIIFASFLFTIGSIIMGVADDKAELLLGRIVVGCGIGLASMTVPVYIAEVSPANLRGRLVTINNCCITIGQLIASFIDGIFSLNEHQGWRYMLSLAVVPSVIQFVAFLFMPETPRWLIAHKRYGEALKVLTDVHGHTSDTMTEFNAIKTSCIKRESEIAENKEKGLIIIHVLKIPKLRKALLVGCSLQIIQQVAGINTVMYYSATIIQMSGVSGDSKVIWMSCATAAVNAVCSFIALLLIERVGRRILTLTSLLGVILSLCFLALSFQIIDIYSPAVMNISTANFYDEICNSYRHCSTCISSGECGFCYINSPEGPQNGSCLPCNDDFCQRGPLNTTCSKSLLNEDWIWSNSWCPSPYSWMALLGLLLYLLCFAPGMGSTPWTINSEIYPLWARSTCFSAATSFNWFFNFLVSLSFLTFTRLLSKAGTFWLYSALSSAGFVFLFLMLPETRGINLEEVDDLFEVPAWKKLDFCCKRTNEC